MANGGEGPLNFVPGEVCVVVTGGPDEPRGLRQAVQERLNQGIAAALSGGPAGSLTPFDDDLGTAGLPAAARLGGGPRGGGGPQVVRLPGRGPEGTLLYRFRLDFGRPADSATQHDGVRRTVNLINREILGGRDGRAGGGVPIVAAAPNWLTAGTQGHTDAGPGARPVAVPRRRVPSGGWRYRFGARPELGQLVDRARRGAPAGSGSDVMVAVLDTSPGRQAIKEDAPARFPENRHLHELCRHVEVDDSPLDLGHLGTLVPNWRDGRHRPQDVYRMPDHGFFVAGIVHDIAPAAPIHLVPVLNEYGVGDVLSLAQVLAELPNRLLRDERQRLVINLSLAADLPPLERLERLWFPSSYADQTEWRRRQTDIQAVFRIIQRNLRLAISWLETQGRVLVVAAAGNDGFGAEVRPEPRYPARYDNVLAVASIDRHGRPSPFSNRGDVVVLGNGVATFGGSAVAPRDGEPPIVEVARDGGAVDAVAGLFTAEQLPLGGGDNQSGWVYWAGTSFAAPVISAIAANVWAENPALAPRDVMDRVLSFAQPRDTDLDCPLIPATQVEA
ncbi:MAG TPA: S8/S53 family peptidase [Chloroflexota bacterium]